MRFKYLNIFHWGKEPMSIRIDLPDGYLPARLEDDWAETIKDSFELDREMWFSEERLF